MRVGAHDRRYLAADTLCVYTDGSAGQSYGAFCNDGLRLEHSGTANDGVGKSMNGGTLVIRNPGGGSDVPGANVLIGNFALFGATGGQLFVAGEAGDRCAVRNSGALAVIEGAGDFCCEYMTNGTVLNLGQAGKGFGNGMSGGIAYQYDPHAELTACYNEASVVVCVLSTSDSLLAPHAEIIQHLLRLHVAATDSPRAAALLADWPAQRGHFRVVIPRALFEQHSAESLQQRLSRKELTDELATSMAGLQIAALKRSWDAKEPIEGGAIPAYGETDTSLMFRLLNRYAVLNKALTVAEKNYDAVILPLNNPM